MEVKVFCVCVLWGVARVTVVSFLIWSHIGVHLRVLWIGLCQMKSKLASDEKANFIIPQLGLCDYRL